MEPRARKNDLLVKPLGGEVLVFDTRSQTYHALNRTAVAVWERCDGRAGMTELAVAAAAASGLPARPEIAALALHQLADAGLLETPVRRPRAGLSRRALIRKLGLAAGLTVALPVVESIVAPQAADAQSGPAPSDMRLKDGIERVGALPNSLPLYRFRYCFRPDVYVGVMAQDVQAVMPEAVQVGPAGIMRVDYGRLGTRLMAWPEWELARDLRPGQVLHPR